MNKWEFGIQTQVCHGFVRWIRSFPLEMSVGNDSFTFLDRREKNPNCPKMRPWGDRCCCVCGWRHHAGRGGHGQQRPRGPRVGRPARLSTPTHIHARKPSAPPPRVHAAFPCNVYTRRHGDVSPHGAHLCPPTHTRRKGDLSATRINVPEKGNARAAHVEQTRKPSGETWKTWRPARWQSG